MYDLQEKNIEAGSGVGPSQVTEIVESILSLGPDFGPISSFSRPKRGLLSGIHGESEMAL
jgi:hypothetical protein